MFHVCVCPIHSNEREIMKVCQICKRKTKLTKHHRSHGGYALICQRCHDAATHEQHFHKAYHNRIARTTHRIVVGKTGRCSECAHSRIIRRGGLIDLTCTNPKGRLFEYSMKNTIGDYHEEPCFNPMKNEKVKS